MFLKIVINLLIKVYRRIKYFNYIRVIDHDKTSLRIYLPYSNMKIGDYFLVTKEYLTRYEQELRIINRKVSAHFVITPFKENFKIERASKTILKSRLRVRCSTS